MLFFNNDTGKDWDKWLPFFLFAYPEVMQRSTGFLSFKIAVWMVCTRSTRPVEEELGNIQRCEQGILHYVLQMKDHLEMYFETAQKAQKRWYDQYARHR